MTNPMRHDLQAGPGRRRPPRFGGGWYSRRSPDRSRAGRPVARGKERDFLAAARDRLDGTIRPMTATDPAAPVARGPRREAQEVAGDADDARVLEP
jgi:hypothetical protein